MCYGNGSTCYGYDGNGQPAPSGWTAPGISQYSLIGRIGNGQPFFIGSSVDISVSTSGTLFIGTNDCNGCFSDNSSGNVGFSYHTWIYHSISPVFSPGDQVLIVQTTGTGAGKYEIRTVSSASGSTLYLSSPLMNSYVSSGESKAQIIRIPQYGSVTINNGGELTASQWDENTGGFLVFKVRDQLTVNSGGKISASVGGFKGGPEATWSGNAGTRIPGSKFHRCLTSDE